MQFVRRLKTFREIQKFTFFTSIENRKLKIEGHLKC
jgi:hypothetical protein